MDKAAVLFLFFSYFTHLYNELSRIRSWSGITLMHDSLVRAHGLKLLWLWRCNSPFVVSMHRLDSFYCIWFSDTCFVSGGWNSRVVSHSVVPLAGENDSVVSAWLAGDSSKNRLEATHMLPGQTLSVNSLDVLEQCLVCGTDGEAVYVHRQVPVWLLTQNLFYILNIFVQLLEAAHDWVKSSKW